jgi:hypothetical protein
VSRMRILGPPALTRTVCRTVWLLKVGVAGKGPSVGVGGKGAAPQVCTHCEAALQVDAMANVSMQPHRNPIRCFIDAPLLIYASAG